MSVVSSTCLELITCSGDMYKGEPMDVPVRVRCESSYISARLATPKSQMRTITSPWAR